MAITAKILKIIKKNEKQAALFSTLNNFIYNDTGDRIEAKTLIANPAISLYTLDPVMNLAIFVELPRNYPLATTPLYYNAQFQNAIRLYTLELDDFQKLTNRIEIFPQRLIFMHNIGRCGSTLLHHALNQFEGIVSFSEPDAFTAINEMKRLNLLEKTSLIQLAQCCMRFIFKKSPCVFGDVGIIKLRSQCTNMIDLISTAFPTARHLFLYRSCFGWVGSAHRRRVLTRTQLNMSLQNAIGHWKLHPKHKHSSLKIDFGMLGRSISSIEQLTISWILMLDQYRNFYQKGCIMPALRYQDLIFKPQEILTALTTHFNLSKNSQQNWQHIFSIDSHSGKILKNKKTIDQADAILNDQEKERITTILRKYSDMRHSEFLAPGTILI